MAPHETATLAGGCFWCLEAAFQDLKGVEQVQSGYAGGHASNPTYEAVCTGTTGHAEVVQITFDPAVVSFRDLKCASSANSAHSSSSRPPTRAAYSCCSSCST